MKICSKCGESKPTNEFNRKKGELRHSYCRACGQEMGKAHYHKNREVNAAKQNANKKVRMNAIKSYLRELKERTPCMDCGNTYPWFVMDFDHVNGKKSSEISLMVKNGLARWRILSEVTKCEVVCANCHRIRTFNRAGLSSDAEME